MKLLYTEFSKRFMEAVAERLRRLDPPVEIAPLGSEPSDMLLVPMTISDEEFEQARAAGVTWIQGVTAGVEQLLTPALAESPIVLTNSSGTSAIPMAEFVFARILEHAKRLRLLAEQQASRTWKTTWLADVAGSTMTIVGLGPIGRHVADLAKAFRMHVIGVRRRPEAGPGPCDEVTGPDGLTEALARADYVVLAPALTAETRRSFGEREISAMKEGALLVNVGRGELVDEPPLRRALQSGRIAAALDVFATEPLPPEDPMWEANALAISPHCSSLTDSLFEGLADLVAENVDRFLHGRPLLNIVDKRSGYPLPEEPAAAPTP
jgi:phosphoglycerate dehydrogenase-like enzyme